MNTRIEELQDTFIEIERQACKDSLYEFLLSFWGIVCEEEFVDNWHIKYICDELQYLAPFLINRLKKPYDLIFNVPPGSTKTTIVLQMYPAWLWTKDGTLRIISSSHGATLSEYSSGKSKDIILSPRYQLLFPDIKLRQDSHSKSRYTTTLGGNRHTTSSGGGATGDHAHIKLMDDLQDISKAGSVPHRIQAVEHMKTLFTREVEKGNSINVLIMQRLNEMDCTSYLLGLSEKRKVKHICLPAEESDKINPPELRKHYVGGLLDPNRMSKEVLEEKKEELGTYGYTSQFGQEPTPPEGGIIKRSWFEIVDKEQYIAMPVTFHFFVDTAYEKKKKIGKDGEARNDPTGVLAVSMFKGQVYIWDYREVWMELPDLIKFLPRWVMANKYSQKSLLMIEPKASGKSTVQTLRRFTKLNVKEIEGDKDSKETELENTSPTIESGRFVLVRGVWNKLFLDRVCGFPNAKHDEAVDLLCYAKRFYFGGDIKASEKAFQKALKYLQ